MLFIIVEKNNQENKMIYISTTECKSCGQCKEECPHDAIKENSTHGYAQFIIDQFKCKQCGKCLEVDCPGDCIIDKRGK